MTERRHLDWDAYLERVRAACFICELVAGNPDYTHHVVYEDGETIAFLNAYPTLRGQTIVAPRSHREQVTGDFSVPEYTRLQAVVHGVGEAVRQTFPTERLYVASLGSQQGNRHVHWHVAPLPPGIPFEEQQAEALRAQRGVLALSAEELSSDARRLRKAVASLRL